MRYGRHYSSASTPSVFDSTIRVYCALVPDASCHAHKLCGSTCEERVGKKQLLLGRDGAEIRRSSPSLSILHGAIRVCEREGKARHLEYELQSDVKLSRRCHFVRCLR